MGIYTAQWKAIKRVHRFMLAWFLSGMTLPIAVTLIVPDVASRQTLAVTGAVLLVYLGIWSVGCLYLRMLVGSFKCPRCGSSFESNPREPRQECCHCGLKRYSES